MWAAGLAGQAAVRCTDPVPIYRLIDEPIFPDPRLAGPEGLVAVGGDLSPQRLLNGYASGIFPWYSEGDPILWFSPDPRMILDTSRLRLSRSHRRVLRRFLAEADMHDGQGEGYAITLDGDFDAVIRACAQTPRNDQDGTWITTDMIEAYNRLHSLGFAHSAETWRGGRLIGGVYGVSVGDYFAAESMFHRSDGASLAALVALIRHLEHVGVGLFDCQLHSAHTERLGAREVPRGRFLDLLTAAVRRETRVGPWQFTLSRDLLLRGANPYHGGSGGA